MFIANEEMYFRILFTGLTLLASAVCIIKVMGVMRDNHRLGGCLKEHEKDLLRHGDRIRDPRFKLYKTENDLNMLMGITVIGFAIGAGILVIQVINSM